MGTVSPSTCKAQVDPLSHCASGPIRGAALTKQPEQLPDQFPVGAQHGVPQCRVEHQPGDLLQVGLHRQALVQLQR
jgi:hypothetical protein